MLTRGMAVRIEQIYDQLVQIQENLTAHNNNNQGNNIAQFQQTLNQIQGNVAAHNNFIQPIPFNPQADNFARWLAEIQQIMQIHNIENPVQQKAYLLRYLGTEGRNSVAGMDLAGTATYQQITDFLNTRFANQVGTPIKRRELELMRPNPGESPEQYGDRVSLSVSKAYPTATVAIRNQMGIAKFISTVQPAFLQEKLACENFDTLIAASNRSRQMLDAHQNSNSFMVGNVSTDDLVAKLDRLNHELCLLKQTNNNASRLRCEICNRSNHLSIDCFFKQKKSDSLSKTVCNYCRNIGSPRLQEKTERK